MQCSSRNGSNSHPLIFRSSRNRMGFPKDLGLSSVIGAIDGSHISIIAPTQQPEKYFNRKKNYSVILQAVAVQDLTFMHVTCSYPGSVHDARVFQNSVVHTWCGNTNYFPGHCHFIGDDAYPLMLNLMVPYKNNSHLGNRQF